MKFEVLCDLLRSVRIRTEGNNLASKFAVSLENLHVTEDVSSTSAAFSGLCVDFLSGAPGIYSARYASTDGHNSTDEENVEKLLCELKGVPEEKRTAYFVSAIALVLPDGTEKCVTGKCMGFITDKVHGEGGFGYDPVFYFPAYERTFGETTEEEKNKVSHRANAVKMLKSELLEIFNV